MDAYEYKLHRNGKLFTIFPSLPLYAKIYHLPFTPHLC